MKRIWTFSDLMVGLSTGLSRKMNWLLPTLDLWWACEDNPIVSQTEFLSSENPNTNSYLLCSAQGYIPFEFSNCVGFLDSIMNQTNYKWKLPFDTQFWIFQFKISWHIALGFWLEYKQQWGWVGKLLIQCPMSRKKEREEGVWQSHMILFRRRFSDLEISHQSLPSKRPTTPRNVTENFNPFTHLSKWKMNLIMFWMEK